MGMQTVGTRHSDEQVAALDADSARLGLDRSGYMRMALDRALKAKVKPAEAAPYKSAPRQKRSDAGSSRTNGKAEKTSPPARATVATGPKEFRGPIPKKT